MIKEVEGKWALCGRRGMHPWNKFRNKISCKAHVYELKNGEHYISSLFFKGKDYTSYDKFGFVFNWKPKLRKRLLSKLCGTYFGYSNYGLTNELCNENGIIYKHVPDSYFKEREGE